MTDGEMLMAAIKADPSDDLARLAYADWLEETGGEAEGAWAELIRVQTNVGGTGPTDCEPRNCTMRALGLPIECPCRLGLDACTWDRGFISRVRCPLSVWMEHGEALTRHPLRRVELVGKSPADGNTNCFPPRDGFGWYRAGVAEPHEPEALPGWLWDLLPPGVSDCSAWRLYPTYGEAIEALSGRLIWMRTPCRPQ